MAVSANDVIVQVDLESEGVLTIVDTASTVLEEVRGLELDPDNNRLLVGDPGNDGVFAVDLTTHAVEVVSQPSVRGDGSPFGAVVSLTLAGASELYVAGQTSETVTRVNLETGDREALVTNCDAGLLSPFQDLDQVLHNEPRGELIISGYRLYSLDLETAQCATLPQRAFPLQIQVTPANQMLAATFRAFMQVDRETGEVVIISK